MRINDITIKNFRGFIEERHFEFDSKMNVILGDNTTGKTSLLHAVQIALGAYLQALKIIPEGKAFSRNFLATDYVKRYSEANKDFIQDTGKPEISVNADFFATVYNLDNYSHDDQVHSISWTRSSNSISKRNANELILEVAAMEQERISADTTHKNSVFPLFLAFGSNRLEKNYRKAQKTRARESKLEKAYKCSLDGQQVDFKSAFNWIYKYNFSLKKGAEFEGTDRAFFEAIAHAIPAIKGFRVDTKNNELAARVQMTKDPEPYWLTYDMMSDGFKAMINICAEIAYRCIQLNGFIGVEAVRSTPGIVMIDEIDLFLHPHWQQHVLQDLQNAFPRMQFIVTTHSPFIVQSVDSQNVIALDSQNAPISPNNRGIEEILACEMGMQGMLRSKAYRTKQELAKKYFELVKAGKSGETETEEVKKKLNELELEAGLLHDPAYEAFLKLNRDKL